MFVTATVKFVVAFLIRTQDIFRCVHLNVFVSCLALPQVLRSSPNVVILRDRPVGGGGGRGGKFPPNIFSTYIFLAAK
jgi:hypothetical protein